MKRIIALLLTLALILSLTACVSHSSSEIMSSEPSSKPEQIENTALEDMDSSGAKIEEFPDSSSEDEGTLDSSINLDESSDSILVFSIDVTGITSLDELETKIEEDLSLSINYLESQWEALSIETDTYEKYCNNKEKVSAFYEIIVLNTEQMCIMLKEYTAIYSRMILDSDISFSDKYKAMEGIEDSLYEDACEEICDEIYEGLLDDMYDYYYEGILEKQPNNVSYNDWYEIMSDEYSQWYDAMSDVYGLYYDTASDIYSLYYNLSSELYSGDFERAEKVYARFVKKLEKDKGIDTGESDSNVPFDTTLRTAENIEELETVIESHITECVQALENEWTAFSSNIDTFEEYSNNVDLIEEFHIHIEESASQLLKMICEYGVAYADLIMQADSDAKDKYKDFEDFKDCIYDDACKIVKDDIYEDLLEDMKEYFYEGIIKDAKDSIPYSEWSDARSDTYNWWSDARSEVYSAWSDTRSDLYSFYSDMRSELYSQDMKGANDELEDFKKKVEKMK